MSQKITATKVLKYATMPGIMPRLSRLFGSGFANISLLMAQVYFMVRLLPANHPYLNPANKGRFGVRHVIAEAANHLVLKKENIDQILIFFALLLGALLLVVQLLILVSSVLLTPAHAGSLLSLFGFGGGGAFSLFQTPDPSTGFFLFTENADIAFLLLDYVFGVPGIFCSIGGICTPVLAGGPNPFHEALHALIQFYTLAILLIGVLIFLYFIVVIVIETATTGSPFGQRFQNGWVPIRLVVAIGLLLPLQYGLSSGQYIVLYTAKWGSGFATNGWLQFNAGIDSGTFFGGNSNPTGERETLVAKPKQGDITPLVMAMTLVHSCAMGYYKTIVRDSTYPPPPSDGFYIRPYFVKPQGDIGNTEEFMEVTPATTFSDGVDFYNNSDIIVRFGERDEERYKNDKGQVSSLCGDIRIKVRTSPGCDVGDLFSGGGAGSCIGEALGGYGPDAIYEFYFDALKDMWFDDEEMVKFADYWSEVELLNGNDGNSCDIACGGLYPSCGGNPPACETEGMGADWRQDRLDFYQADYDAAIYEAWENYVEWTSDLAIEQEVLDRGWGGAGIWYNRIAQINGGFVSAVFDVPGFDTYPKVMEEVREARRAHNADPELTKAFSPRIESKDSKVGREVDLSGGADAGAIASFLDTVYQYWMNDGQNLAQGENQLTGNIIIDVINIIMGTTGLFDLVENTNTHPLAQLVALGKGLVEASIRNIGVSAGSAFLGGLAGAVQFHSGEAVLKAASSLFVSTAFITLTAGFILFYIVPFLPFVYFYFAVGSWVKSIFEAMVGVPLWALAHLRLDGEGLPGESAQNGYYLILEIFLRPILTVFGLIAAMTIFAAQARVLNIVWELVTNNLSGFNDAPTFGIGGIIEFKRGIIDQFFFTIIYAIMIYMLATASFKLIDTIPDNILRWLGAGVSSFSDINDDPLDGLKRYAALGGVTFGQQLTGQIQPLSQSLGGTLGNSLQASQGARAGQGGAG